MQHKAIHTEAIDEGLDRHNLTQLKKRFLKINTSRLTRTRSALGERQRQFLDILPLLLHVNHPMLPGYVSRSAPAGICNYRPDTKELDLARSMARSFHPHRDPVAHCEIEGLYLMGSVGTVAHSDKSDLDVWVCHNPGLAQARLVELDRKCAAITAWAATLRLEVHFFPMDYEAFKQGELRSLDEESSGSAQHWLLLDEFYRTALFLAGRLPLWWFVPTAAEDNYHHYAETLLHRRFLPASTVLDFGGVAAIPTGEFIGAGIWQLYKAIESPYKSVLKLLLLESYVSQHPQLEPLSLTYKQKVYDGHLDVDELDPYIMIYRRIEAYLAGQNQTRRLELARRCLYFKINKPLSRPFTGKSKSWQRKLLERLTREWGWSNTYIQMLDERFHWKADRVIEERSLLVNELNHSYRFLSEFASGCGVARAINAEELTVLGRKLQAAFERRPGKIEWINPGISGDMSEPVVTITQTADADGSHWSVAGPPPVNTHPFKQSAGLVELMLWCYCNGVIDSATHFDLSATSIDAGVARRLLMSLQRWLPTSAASPTHDTFRKSAAPTQVLLLVNVGTEAQAHLHEQGIQRTSNRTDAFGYSGFQDNLVTSIDLILRNSWHEVSCRRFEGRHALLHALEEYFSLSLPGSQQLPPALTIECIGNNHSTIITQRVKEWFDDITACYYTRSAPGATFVSRGAKTRYLFAMAGNYYSLQFKGTRLNTERHGNETALIRWLGQEQAEYSPFVLDKRMFIKHPLRLFAEHGMPGAINVFFHPVKGGLRIYLMDEKGSLLTFTAHSYTLAPLHRFLKAVANRQARINAEMTENFSICPVYFFELYKDRQQQVQCQKKRIATETRPGLMIDVKAVVSCDKNDNYRYSFYCDQEEFSHLQHGNQLFSATASYIRSRRSAAQHYPLYLSDLDLDLCRKQLSNGGQLQTIHYLRLKLELEQALNAALPKPI